MKGVLKGGPVSRSAYGHLFYCIPNDMRTTRNPVRRDMNVPQIQFWEISFLQLLLCLSAQGTPISKILPDWVADLLPKVGPTGMICSHMLQEVESSTLENSAMKRS